MSVIHLERITYQSRRFFVLPWEAQADGAVRFLDRGYLGQQMRLLIAVHVLAMGLGFLGLAWINSVHSLRTNPWVPAVGAALCLGGLAMVPGYRSRTIELSPDGRVAIRSSKGPAAGSSAAPARIAKLELREVWISAYMMERRMFALLITDGDSVSALCFAGSPQRCVEALRTMPAQLQTLECAVNNDVLFARTMLYV